MFKVLAITGKAQSGKSTAREILRKLVKKRYGDKDWHVEWTPFAGKLKEIAFDLFRWDGDKELYYPMEGTDEELIKPIPDAGRQLLINIGQVMRSIRPAVWAEYIYNLIRERVDDRLKNTIYVVDDLRFKNELDVMNRFGKDFVLIKIHRNEQLDIDDISEKDLDDLDENKYNLIIDNNGTEEDLEKEIAKILPLLIGDGNAQV